MVYVVTMDREKHNKEGNMAIPNFRIADVMQNFFERAEPDDIDVLKNYRDAHPYKFSATRKWAFGNDTNESIIIDELTKKKNDNGTVFVPVRLETGKRSTRWFEVYKYTMQIGRIVKYRKGRGWIVYPHKDVKWAVNRYDHPLGRTLVDSKREAVEWICGVWDKAMLHCGVDAKPAANSN
jgi:hypothetical protein